MPSYKIFENDKVLAFLDLSRFTEGHTIVIPKKHFQYVWDIIYGSEYYTAIQQIANHFREKLGFQYVDSMTWGRKVPHAHTHLVPHNGDNAEWKNALKHIGNMQEDSLRRLTPEEGKRIVEKFKMT